MNYSNNIVQYTYIHVMVKKFRKIVNTYIVIHAYVTGQN